MILQWTNAHTALFLLWLLGIRNFCRSAVGMTSLVIPALPFADAHRI